MSDYSPPDLICESIAYFDIVKQALYEAVQNSDGFIDYFYKIGGYSIKFRFAGEALVPHLTPAMAHLTSNPVVTPSLTIYLWDSSSTHTRLPPPAWQATDQIFRGEVAGYNNERINTAFHQWAEVFSILDHDTNQAIFWAADADDLDYSMGSAPLRDILHWWMPRRGSQLLHGGGVGIAEGGILLAGKGGQGKSTTALACLNAGLSYAGDDHVLVQTYPKPYLHSLYNTAKLKADHIQAFPNLTSSIENRALLERQKARMFLQQHYPTQMITGFPLRAILLPQVTGRTQTTLRKVSPIEGLKALAPSTLYMLPAAGAEAMKRMAQLVRDVPSYRLELGTEISQIPNVIIELLK